MSNPGSILIISPNLQPDQCGVSDYTLVLKSYLIEKLQYKVFCLAISDRYITQTEEGMDYLRVPYDAPADEKISQLKATITTFDPARIIFHFVSYGYQKLGLPFWLLRVVPLLKTINKVDFIIHELWVGGSVYDPFRTRVLGRVQKKLVLRFFRQFSNSMLITTTAVTAGILGRERIAVVWNPVFNNIIAAPDELAVPLSLKTMMENEQCLKLVLFGSIPPDADADTVMDFIRKQQQISGLPVLVISLGKLRKANTPWTEMLKQESETITFHSTGMLSAPAIAWVLLHASAGLSTYPFPLWTKSGAIAALLAHGLHVVIFGDLPKKVTGDNLPGFHPAVSFYRDLPANFNLHVSKSSTSPVKTYNDNIFSRLSNALHLQETQEDNFIKT